ncbi:winged helix-turn-helix transcriptional regulator [Prauserella cavernicola]|uniref:Winged helix-turn-helix transcriptional regulator n=1 Tax=Prauserella cavernicola TaxID=2800127 RepID=A0A934QNI6_9PSEU|nr:winged helix-turn-helix transcriptional regulator [Prauserella cavernicola]MBK1785302.1 winged helix-turn-helix transcriptional regulator [Prauserella cavernicola]
MSGKRTYDDPCGVARALNLIGERWALLVVRELLHGPKRFTDIRSGLPHASQNVLSTRLRELEESGIVRRRKLGPPVSAQAYELTERGRELEPVLLALARWGSRTPLTSEEELSADALVLALRTTFDVQAAAGLRAGVELRLGEDMFHAEVADGDLTMERGAADEPDAVIEAGSATLRSVVFGGRKLTDAQRKGEARVEGDGDAARRFVELFPRPSVR